MRILVTGATGRIGRNLSRSFLDRGDQVRSVVLPDDPGLDAAREVGVECIVGNLRDLDTAIEAVAGVDAIVHLGAMMMWGGPEVNPIIFEDNIRGTFNLAHAAALEGVQRFVFASTDESYPSLTNLYTPIDEGHPQKPTSFYGLTKLVGEDILQYYYRTFKLPIAIARFALVFEPWETTSPSGSIGKFLYLNPMLGVVERLGGAEAAQALRAQSQGDHTLLLSRDTDGMPYVFHCVDVRDIVQGLTLLMENPAAIGGAFNLSGPSAFSFDQVIPYIAEKTGFPVVEANIPGRPIRIEHSTAKARLQLGYEPRYTIFQSIDDGVEQMARR